MNLPLRKQSIPILALLLIALVLLFLPQMDADFFAGLRYSRCTHLAAGDPAKALALAKAWRKGKPLSPLAQHCEAVALYASKDYLPAAEDFMALARESADRNSALSSQLALQAATSYRQAGRLDLAAATAESVLALTPGNQGAMNLLAEIAKENANPPGSPPTDKTAK